MKMRPPKPIIQIGFLQNACRHPARSFSKTSFPRTSAAPLLPSPRLKPGYFLSNSLLGHRLNGGQDKRGLRNTVTASPNAQETAPSAATTSPGHDHDHDYDHPNAQLPHRKRQAAKRAAGGGASAALSGISGAPTEKQLPPDASSILAGVAAQQPAHSLRRTFSSLLSLTKPRLTVLVVLSAMAPYALYPVPSFLTSTALDAPSLSPLTLLFLTIGTTLCSGSANAFNMLYEPRTDALMSRTRARPLVRKLISTRVAVLFAVGSGLVGIGALYLGVNPTVAFLGAANIVLYAGIYTPMKRLSSVNTWVGAIVGGIPPLMGWAAAAGESATADGTWRELLFASDGSSIGGWLFAGVLFAWQFPHFMALSWGVREEYKAAGLRMLCWVNPARNARVALRYSFVFLPLCIAMCATGVTEWSYAVTSLPVNIWLMREAVKFWRHQGHKGSARSLFWASVWHLPVVMVLALLQKKGMWQRVWRSVVGAPEDDDDDDEWEYVDEEE